MMSDFTTLSHPERCMDSEAELVQLAQNIRAWQERTSPRLSDGAIVRQFPALGSTKTYRALREGETDGLIVLNHLPKYQSVWRLIEEATGADGREEIYPDLQPTFDACMAAASLIPQKGRERIVLIEGETGSGKTTAMEAIAARYPGQAIVFQATESWSSANAMLCDMLVTLGVYTNPLDDGESKMPVSMADRLAKLVLHLKKKRHVLLIDEGHHMGPAGLNILKGILNLTDAVIIVAAIPTLWGKLTKRSWAEAAQLVYNRMFERVRLLPPSPSDVELFLGRRVESLAGAEWNGTAGKVAEMAKHYGGYAFLRRVANKIRGNGSEVTMAGIVQIAEGLQLQLKTR